MNVAVFSANENLSRIGLDRGDRLPRVERRLRHRMRGLMLHSTSVDVDEIAHAPDRSMRQFVTAFAGGLVFFSILIA